MSPITKKAAETRGIIFVTGMVRDMHGERFDFPMSTLSVELGSGWNVGYEQLDLPVEWLPEFAASRGCILIIEDEGKYMPRGHTRAASGTAQASRASLKSMIRTILDETPGLDEMDIAERLDIEFELACSLIDELVGEGAIERGR